MIKICCLHKNVSDIPSMLRFLLLDPSLAGELVWDEEAPDILIASEWIYYKSALFRKFRDLYGKSGIKVSFIGEAIEPDFNVFDYCVGFSDSFKDNPAFLRLPSPYHMFSEFLKEKENPIKTPAQARAELERKSGFCSFLYSNPKANPVRDQLFYEISAYKKVDSLGRHLNNVSTPGTGYIGHKGEGVLIKANYKFSISSENSCFRGYTSEKLLTSLEAHSLPIYWGNPNVADDINPECFIDAGKMSGMDELISVIERFDNDDALWCEMVSKPWMTPSQESAHKIRTEAFLQGMRRLLTGELPPIMARGYHVDMYRDHFLSGEFFLDSRKEKLRNRLSQLSLSRHPQG